MLKVKKILGIGLISIAALSLSGCGLTSFSDEERYRPINNVKDAIDLPSSGEVIDQTYDANNGIFSPSIFVATIRGDGTYDILSKRIRAIPESLCNAPAVEQVSCTIGQVTVLLRRESEEDKDIGLRITDPYSGRKPE